MSEPLVIRLRHWWQAARYHYTTSVSLPAFLGGAMAWHDGYPLEIQTALLGLGMLIFLELSLIMTDDYFDFLRGNDTYKPGNNVHVFTGGSGVVPGVLIRPRTLWIAQLVGYLLFLGLGITLAQRTGPYMYGFLAWGFFWSYFHSAPPIRLSYRGLTEFGMMVNLGSVVTAMVYYAMAGQWSWEAFWVAAPLGCLQFAMMLMQEVTDFDDDLRVGKLHLALRLGRRGAVQAHLAALVMAYAAPVGAVAYGLAPAWVLVTLLTVPMAWRPTEFFLRYYNHKQLLEWELSNFRLFRVHNYTGLLLILTYTVFGLRRTGDWGTALRVVGILALVWAPVGMVLHRLAREQAALPSR